MSEGKDQGITAEIIRQLREEIKDPREEIKSYLNPEVNKDSPGYYRILHKLLRMVLEQKQESCTDKLTGLPNRRGFEEALQREAARLKRDQSKNAVIVYLDLNGLKQLNDREGHQAGDEMIKKAAEILKKYTRNTDLSARLGGDEFAAILTNTDLEGAKAWWEQILTIFQEHGIRIAAGCVLLDWENPTASVQNADRAMYLAKDRSRTTESSEMLVFHPSMKTEAA